MGKPATHYRRQIGPLGIIVGTFRNGRAVRGGTDMIPVHLGQHNHGISREIV